MPKLHCRKPHSAVQALAAKRLKQNLEWQGQRELLLESTLAAISSGRGSSRTQSTHREHRWGTGFDRKKREGREGAS